MTLLAELLVPYEDTLLVGSREARDDLVGWRFADAPPDAVAEALAVLPPELAAQRPNDQPPAGWLVDQARLLGGLLAGVVAPARTWLRVDAICVPRAVAETLALAVDEAWPAEREIPAALDLAVAETWLDWTATEPSWSGNGRKVPAAMGPGAVVGLWWD